MAQFNPLRPITQRLNATPVHDLPRYAGFLATSILNCAEFLQSSSQKSDGSVQVHKLITRVSSLLQDRTLEGRLTGIVLVKALAEVVTPHDLANSGSLWVRNLLSCLNKPDPPQIKKLCILAITRIFLLTHENQAMVRDITTPSLPAFMTASLAAIKPATISIDGEEKQVLSSLLHPVLQCWVQLLKRFPSTIRPFVPSIRTIVLSLASQQIAPKDVRALARQVFATLHFCAPKDGAASEWTQSVKLIVEAVHQTADVVLRSVIEEWSPATARSSMPPKNSKANTEVHIKNADAVGMDKWTGIQAGCSRLLQLLQLLTGMVVSQHAQAVTIPLTEMVDVCARLVAVPWPAKGYALRENKEITRDEREELFANLPRIHCAVLELHVCITKVFGGAIMPVARQLLSQTWDVFESEASDDRIRCAIYNDVTEILLHRTVCFQTSDAEHIAKLIHACCRDLDVESTRKVDSSKGSAAMKSTNLNLDITKGSKQKAAPTRYLSPLSKAAWNLLPALLTHLPGTLLTSGARAEIDRTAILIEHEEATLASVMNPPVPRKGAKVVPSILPFLARSNNDSLAFEALVRPRMPVLQSTEQSDVAGSNEDQDEMSSQEEINEVGANLRTVTDHVTQQLEETATTDEIPTLQTTKKRDFATLDEPPTTSSAEVLKKIKSGSSPMTAEGSHVVSGDHREDNAEEMDIVEGTDAEESLQEATSTAHTQNEAKVEVSSGNTKFSEAASSVAFARDDDSDDSELPEMDGTLNSDDDNDEEEDED